MFLNKGSEIYPKVDPKRIVNLARRDDIAGLRYGIEGMRVGGQRQLIISPHLAYGADGVPGLIPPNAVIRCNIELLAVREHGVLEPEDYPAGKHLFLFHPGEAARNLSRWQFGLEEAGNAESVSHIQFPENPGEMPEPLASSHAWMQTRRSCYSTTLWNYPQKHPKDCLNGEDLWADSTEPGNSITRDRASNTPCITIGVIEHGRWLCHFLLAEKSPAMLESPLMKVVKGLIDNAGSEASK